MTSINKELLTNLTSSDTVIITPNQRLAATLLLEFNQYQSQSNTWLKPNILSLSNWENTLWQDYIFELPKKLLTPQEESIIWQELIKHSETGNNILNPVKTAELAKQAWHSLIQWNYGLSDLGTNSINTTVFYQWAESFQEYCDKNNAIDRSSAIKAIANNKSFLTQFNFNNYIFYEFLEFTPLQDLLINNLSQHKSIQKINHDKHSDLSHSIKRLELDTQEQELTAMAQWAKKIEFDNSKKQNKQNSNTENKIKIACVIPNLHQIKNEAERVFKRVFNSDNPPVDFSAGEKLAQYPVIQLFINCLAIGTSKQNKQHDFELFSAILRSPYLTNAETEFSLRMLIDKKLRSQCNSQLSLTSYISQLKYIVHKLDTTTILLTIFENLLKFQKNSQAQPVLKFSQHSLKLLLDLGWPGERSLNSTEYQVTQRLITLLDELHSLICFAKPSSAQQAFALLNQLVNNTVFQVEKEKTSIQVLGLLEASGMQFDYLWMMGLDDLTWPSKAKPNSFLPYQLQSDSKMPHASAEREFEFCKTLTKQLINNSKQITVSSAKVADNKILRPSALINYIEPSQLYDYINLNIDQNRDNFFALPLEALLDHTGTKITKNSSEEIRGGTEIIRRQSLCPFMAYASLRLNADGLEPLTDAPDALLRGSLLHKALELFWLSTENQANLLKLTNTELDSKTNHAVSQAISEINQNYFSDLMLEIEQTRLIKLIKQTIDIEKQREHFKIVGLEQKQKYNFEHFTVHMKADRIDQLDNGEYVVIDYKTGLPTMSSWFGERPKEPQLPLYSIIQSNTAHLIFAQVRLNNCIYKGISQDAESFSPNIKTVKNFEKTNYDFQASNWSAQQQQWKITIDQLANDFAMGKAAVDPLDYTACNFCDLHSLCRINDTNNQNIEQELVDE